MIRGPYNELSAFGNENCAASANSAYFGGGVDSSTRMQVSSFSPESTVTPNEMGTSANGLFFFWNDGGGGPNPASMQQQQPPVNNGIRVNGWQQPQIEQGYVPKNGENANYMQGRVKLLNFTFRSATLMNLLFRGSEHDVEESEPEEERRCGQGNEHLGRSGQARTNKSKFYGLEARVDFLADRKGWEF